MSLGYDRNVYAIVPKKNAKGGDAMSLFAVNKVEVKSINDITVEEFVASGDPATNMAGQDQAIKQLRNKIYGDD